jgi:hypothetical protein
VLSCDATGSNNEDSLSLRRTTSLRFDSVILFVLSPFALLDGSKVALCDSMVIRLAMQVTENSIPCNSMVIFQQGLDMGNRRFSNSPAGLTVANIILLTGAECHDATRLSHLITDVAPLELAGLNDLAFIESNKYTDALATTRAGACLMLRRFESCAPKHPHPAADGAALSVFCRRTQ